MLKLTPNISSISSWKPMRWHRFVENELFLNRVNYVPVDKYKDIGVIYKCFKSMDNHGLSRIHFISYVRSIVPNLIPGQVLPDLSFLWVPFKSYFGIELERYKTQKKVSSNITISKDTRKWLDAMKIQKTKSV